MSRMRSRSNRRTTTAGVGAPSRRSGPAVARAARRSPGRPPVHAEPWTKVTVVLFDRQITFLERLAANIRAQSGTSISRAQLIRSLVDAMSEADIDLTAARSEKDLKATLLARLGKYRL